MGGALAGFACEAWELDPFELLNSRRCRLSKEEAGPRDVSLEIHMSVLKINRPTA